MLIARVKHECRDARSRICDQVAECELRRWDFSGNAGGAESKDGKTDAEEQVSWLMQKLAKLEVFPSQLNP